MEAQCCPKPNLISKKISFGTILLPDNILQYILAVIQINKIIVAKLTNPVNYFETKY